MTVDVGSIVIRQMNTRDFAGVVDLTRDVYPASPPWSARQLVSHLEVFPEGQLVAVETATQRVVGMAASLIVLWTTTTPERAGATSPMAGCSPTTTPPTGGRSTAPR